MAEPFVKKTYYGITLDPVHVGTGGYRLGRVDNTITREPGTNLPKIPGSSIAGVTRAYTAMAIQNGNFITIDKDFKIDYSLYRKCKYQRPAYQFIIEENGTVKVDDDKAIVKTNTDKKPMYTGENPHDEKYYSCAGKGADDGEGHCGETDCPVCVGFGFSKGKKGTSFQGLVQFYDARILFFPVHSMVGPVWVTCKSVLMDFKEALNDQTFNFDPDLIPNNDGEISTSLIDENRKLNLGWLYLTKNKKQNIITNHSLCLNNLITDRLVVVSDKIFSHIVNDNLEVRTSVAINPQTGAAEEGALFTYEAIPRATVMWFDVIYNKPEYFRINGNKSIEYNKKGNGEGWKWLKENVEKGLAYLETLGLGGMNTRGMGRMRILNREVE